LSSPPDKILRNPKNPKNPNLQAKEKIEKIKKKDFYNSELIP